MIHCRWVPLVNHFSLCCCRCTLRTGTLIIAWLGLIGELLQVMDTFVQLYYYEDIMEEEKQEQKLEELIKLEQQDQDDMIEGNTEYSDIVPESPNSDEDNVVTYSQPGYFSPAETKGALVIRIFFGVFHIIVHACLLYGAWKEKPKFMLPYIIINFIFIFMVFCIVLLFSFIIFSMDIFVGFVVLLIGFALTALVAYLWAGVYTYYRHLTEPMLPQQDTALTSLDYVKPEESEPIVNPDEIQKAYENIEEKLRYNQPQPV